MLPPPPGPARHGVSFFNISLKERDFIDFYFILHAIFTPRT
jgi:hypothetical protein